MTEVPLTRALTALGSSMTLNTSIFLRKLLFWGCFLGGIAFVGFCLLAPDTAGKKAQMEAEYKRIIKENKSLEDQNRQLQLEMEALKERWDYLEKTARDELGLVKANEMVFPIPIDNKGREPRPGARSGGKGIRAPLPGVGQQETTPGHSPDIRRKAQ